MGTVLHSRGLAWRWDRDEEGCGKRNFSPVTCLVIIQLGMASWELHRVVKAETGTLSPGYGSGLS